MTETSTTIGEATDKGMIETNERTVMIATVGVGWIDTTIWGMMNRRHY
jgi:hypothetical protein